jgi:hypothetical protein
MPEENLNEEQPTFIVADRRKFNTDGSLREEGKTEETNVKAASQTTATNDMPDVFSAEPADVFESVSENKSDLSSDFSGSTTGSSDEPFDETDIPGAENPASFANFLLSLASQTAAALGLTENPMTGGGRRVDLESSRYWLEVLGMLHEKTAGNLHPQEQKLFDGLLSDLRMQYVQITRAAEAQLKKQAAQKFSGKDILGR